MRIFTVIQLVLCTTIVNAQDELRKPVEQLRVKSESFTLLTAKKPREMTGVILTGRLLDSPKQNELGEVFDFLIERQELAVDDTTEKLPQWKVLNIKDARVILEDAVDFATDPVPAKFVDPVITMPLPLIKGTWPSSVSYPDLADDFRLFRYIDCSVKPSHHYRYRVRIVYQNPSYGQSSDPFVTREKRHMTAWSQPSSSITVD